MKTCLETRPRHSLSPLKTVFKTILHRRAKTLKTVIHDTPLAPTYIDIIRGTQVIQGQDKISPMAGLGLGVAKTLYFSQILGPIQEE